MPRVSLSIIYTAIVIIVANDVAAQVDETFSIKSSSSTNYNNFKKDSSLIHGNLKLDKSILDFGINLFEVLAHNYTGNIVLSPLAVQTVLVIMYTGALGNTTNIMTAGLGFTGFPSTDRVAKAFSQLVTPILISPVIQMATGIYCNDVYQIHPVWQIEAQLEFLTTVELVNYSQPIVAASFMNSYISNITFGRITTLMQPNWFNSNTSVVLVNALYLNGPWKIPFEEIVPNQPFTNVFNPNTSLTVNMMHVQNTFNYYYDRSLDTQIIELQYLNSNLSLVIFYPNQCNGMDLLMNNLKTSFDFVALHDKFYQRPVELLLPEFIIDYEVENLEFALKKIGFEKIFNPVTADFQGALEVLTSSISTPGISGPNMYIDRVVHKSVLNVTQYGINTKTFSAAIDELVFAPQQFSSTNNHIPFMNVNHSFVFGVKNLQDVLYIGRFISPKEAQYAGESSVSIEHGSSSTTHF